MTKIEIDGYSDIKVRSDEHFSGGIYLNVHGGEVELYLDEARELVKALKKHIKKAEGK